MSGALRYLLLAGCCVALSNASAPAAEKKPAAPVEAPNPCDVYGPGYRPVGATGICIKLGGSVSLDVGLSPTDGHPSAATSTDWIRTKPARGGN